MVVCHMCCGSVIIHEKEKKKRYLSPTSLYILKKRSSSCSLIFMNFTPHYTLFLILIYSYFFLLKVPLQNRVKKRGKKDDTRYKARRIQKPCDIRKLDLEEGS